MKKRKSTPVNLSAVLEEEPDARPLTDYCLPVLRARIAFLEKDLEQLQADHYLLKAQYADEVNENKIYKEALHDAGVCHECYKLSCNCVNL